ncbi:EI24 domain-containing protein [Flammeovirgaceae bacterium SG7u.111]|nr:EI24 domain-containing protein [Flammeovirgaceae bacterium SG7u.132]WPO36578.1 EI24 domain-containing protein [Flammeovirgaceae bacterium SG7u.111]
MLKQLKTGFFSYFKAVTFINQYRLWKAVLLPSFISLSIFIALLVIALIFAPDVTTPLTEWILAKLEGSWVGDFLAGLVSFLVRAITLLFFFLLYKSFMLNVMSPILSLVADKVGEVLHGKKEKEAFEFVPFAKEILLGTWDALLLFLKETAIVLLILILSLFIPLLSPFTAVIIFLVQSYFVGLSMLDLSASYKKYSMRELKAQRKTYKSFALGNGMAFTLLFFIPILGVLIAPSVGVVAACLGMEENNSDEAII